LANQEKNEGVMILVEHRNRVIVSIVYELLKVGNEIAKKLSEPFSVVLLGENVSDLIKKIESYAVDKIYYCDHKIFSEFRDDPYSQILINIIEEVKPRIFLIGATAMGRSLAPRIATKLKTGLSAECFKLDTDNEKNLIQKRYVLGSSKIASIICPKSYPQMVTIQHKAFEVAELNEKHSCEKLEKIIDISDFIDRTKIIAFKSSDEKTSIEDADVIVSGGRGLGGADGFKLLHELAEMLGGVVGASRSAVDEDWIDYHHQVGLSGKTVRPKLYFACGISGSIQHIAGMQSSEVIIAINKDPNAPIFKIATFGIVGDVYEVIPELNKIIKGKIS
jgi:electron transfer flavoprotein alpha subunit